MTLHKTTPTPNEFFSYLPKLTNSEVRVLLVIIRQTFGWKDLKTKQRKLRDRMTYSFLIKRTGLYRTVITETIKTLIDKNLIIVTDKTGKRLNTAIERKGKRCLFYQYQHVRNSSTTSSEKQTEPIPKLEHNKRNTIKNKIYQKKVKNIDELLEVLVRANQEKMNSYRIFEESDMDN